MADFNSLPFPMQLMQMRAMQQQMQQEQAMRQARGQAGQVLYDQMGERPAIPPPPGPGPQAPPPGAMSPGGGNPMAQGGPSVMAPPQAGPQMQPGSVIPPPPMLQAGAQPPMMQPGGAPMGAVPPPPGAQPGGAPMGQMPQQIPPFRPLPSAAYTPQGGLAPEVPPPPAQAAQAPPAAREPNPFDLKGIIGGLRRSGIPANRVMDMLDTLAPVMNAQNKQELAGLKLENQALTAASLAYARTKQADAAQQRADTGVLAEERRGDQGQQRIDIRADEEARRQDQGQQRIDLAKQRLGRQVGGVENISKWEFDPADPTKVIGGWTKTGKHVKLDQPGVAVPGKPGGAGGGQAAVRANLVKGSSDNALRLLDEVEKLFPNATTSSYFGYHADNPLTKGATAGAKGLTMSQKDRQIDSHWAGIIEEVGPVLSGGLRNSDSFRRFLIDQAPALGDDKATVKNKIKILRDNVSGSSHYFFDKFASSPQMWGEGVTKEQVEAARAGRAGGAPGADEAGEAQRAISAGADAAKVRARYKERTGKDLR